MKKSLEIKSVEVIRCIRDAHYEQLKEKTWNERVAFYQRAAHLLHDELKFVEAKVPEVEAG